MTVLGRRSLLAKNKVAKVVDMRLVLRVYACIWECASVTPTSTLQKEQDGGIQQTADSRLYCTYAIHEALYTSMP